MTLGAPQALPQLLLDDRITWSLLEPGVPALALLDRLMGGTTAYADEAAIVQKRTPSALPLWQQTFNKPRPLKSTAEYLSQA